jgi:non-ribosomal peptide synthetase component F
MSATLTTLRDRVEQALADSGNAIWSTSAIDEAIRQALHEYSKTRPQRAVGTITLSADGREISVSSLTGLLSVLEVWCTYTAADPEFPPNRRGFQYWPEQTKIYVWDEYAPQSGDVVRVFYTKLQTLSGLDSATSTTFPDDDESLIAIGAAGYAATSRAVDLAEQVTLDRLTAQQVRAWGLSKLQEFRSGLKTVARRMALETLGHVELPDLDRHEQGSEWA